MCMIVLVHDPVRKREQGTITDPEALLSDPSNTLHTRKLETKGEIQEMGQVKMLREK